MESMNNLCAFLFILILGFVFFFLIPHFLWMIFGVVVIFLMVEWWTGFRFGFVDVGDN